METMAAATLPFVPPVAGAPAEPVHPARETRGAVTVEAALEPARVGAGGVFRAVVTLAIPPPWTVNGHRPPAGHLVPLTVSVPDDRFVVGLVQYPECSTCSRSARVTVTLRAGTKVPAGPTALRLTARFQRCRGSACEAPESVLLEAPLVVEAPGR
jgi:hypothetical protein